MTSFVRRFLLFLFASLGVLCLFNVAPAKAQDTPVWSATLTVAAVSTTHGSGVGCGGAGSNSCSMLLTNNSFMVGGTTYSFSVIQERGVGGGLIINFGMGKNSQLQALKFCVGSNAFEIPDNAGTGAQFSSASLGWSVGNTVSLSIGSSCPQASQTLTVDARPSCGSTVTDMSVQPSYALTLTPAPAAATSTQARPVATDEIGWRSSLSIEPSGSSIRTTRNPFAHLRNVYPGFRGFEFRLADDHTVTYECSWTFREQTPRDNDRTFNPAPPPSGPTGGGPSPGGGGSPPAVPSDPAPDSPRCGTDREDLKRFYEMTGGEGWDRHEYWNSREPLGEWYGVETEDGSVVSLRLPDNNLSGDMPTRELLCLEDKELVELALWDNDDLTGDVPEELVLAVERAVLREIAEMLNINPEWFEDYEDPHNFENWHEGVTTDEDGRVIELDLTGEGVIGELPESVSQLRRLGEIMVTRSSGGCALSPKDDSSAFGLFLLTLFVFAALGRKRARG